FFFQAEDGIRDGHVTGVQTCALPISGHRVLVAHDYSMMVRVLIVGDKDTVARKMREGLDLSLDPKALIFKGLIPGMDVVGEKFRSEERRVGKECRARWWAEHERENSR